MLEVTRLTPLLGIRVWVRDSRIPQHRVAGTSVNKQRRRKRPCRASARRSLSAIPVLKSTVSPGA